MNDLVQDILDWQLGSVRTTTQKIQLRRHEALITAINTYTFDYPFQYITGMTIEH
jgi:hypothetical protein